MGSGPSKEGIAPGAVKFGQIGEVGPIKGVALIRPKKTNSTSSSTTTDPVVISVAKDNVDLYNAFTGK